MEQNPSCEANGHSASQEIPRRFISMFCKVFTAVKIKVEVICVVMSCITVLGCQRFGEPCCLHLQGEAKPPKRWYPPTTLHDITIQKTST